MKTSIFDMNFTLPPLVVMTEVVKKMPHARVSFLLSMTGAPGECNWC